MRKILIIGGVAGGASTAARLRRLNEEDQIIMFEKGPHVSFSNCSLPYQLSGVVKTPDELIMMTPEKFQKQYRIEARTSQEVVEIVRDRKVLKVKNLETGKTYEESYDVLVLSPGAKPIVPPIPGLEYVNAFTLRNVVDIKRINAHLEQNKSKDVVVIGGGFIGVEACENIKKAGYNVTLIEAENQIMRPFDYDMVQILHKVIVDHGVDLILSDRVERFTKDMVILSSGKAIHGETIVLAIGVKPEIDLAQKAGLVIGKSGGIKTDQNYRTNDPAIYAVGDVIEGYGTLLRDYYKLSLAGPAQKQARSVADHINGMRVDNRGLIGSSVIKIFDYNAAATGLTEGFIKAMHMNLDYDVVWAIPGDRVNLMPGASPLHLKLIYEVPTGKIIGAQAIGRGAVDKRIDILATVIKFGGTIDDLKDLELCYAPQFGTAKDVVNFGGYIATNLMNEEYKQVPFTEVRNLIDQKATIIDVREVDEFNQGHIKGAINMPLSQFREQLNQLPKDQPLYLHCKSGQRSYNAVKILLHKGYTDVYSIAGGFMALCFYEYYNDKTQGREPVVTAYNFN